jgi:hypothetical protein
MKAIKTKDNNTGDKKHLSQEDLQAGIKTFEKTDDSHATLETPEGKNNSAEPAVYRNHRKART